MLRYHALVAVLVVVACVVVVAKADEDDEPLVDVPEPVDEDQVLPRESGLGFNGAQLDLRA